ncbi:MAG: hypothetical protein LBI10_07500 [Deltaproteobacteria bacterium]|nr:hypothetical protein [Deltaproteobacteria bacterium]
MARPLQKRFLRVAETQVPFGSGPSCIPGMGPLAPREGFRPLAPDFAIVLPSGLWLLISLFLLCGRLGQTLGAKAFARLMAMFLRR